MRPLTIADKLAALIGSWPFIIVQTVLLATWVVINATRLVDWDEYPFILLNLMLSFQAAYTGPILLMAANRQSEIDRRRAVKNLAVNLEDHEILKGLRDLLEKYSA